MTPILKVTHSTSSNRFCVPAALSALTGLSVDEIMPLIHKYLGDVEVSGLYSGIAVRILKDLGYTVKELPTADQLLLEQFYKKVGHSYPYLVIIKGHALVAHGCGIYDNQHPQGIEVWQYNKRRAKIEEAWEVSK